MSGLKDIPIVTEPPEPGTAVHHNALALLHEIRHALQRLLEAGEGAVIDLRAIPFGPGDEAFLVETLGKGEVSATVEALGPTRVWETGYPGVWLVDHYNAAQERIAFQVEVTEIPAILRAGREEMGDSIHRMEERLRQLRQQG